LGFFHIPDFEYNLETPKPSPTALIKVTGGKLMQSQFRQSLQNSSQRTGTGKRSLMGMTLSWWNSHLRMNSNEESILIFV
jgi:hypothetical protein